MYPDAAPGQILILALEPNVSPQLPAKDHLFGWDEISRATTFMLVVGKWQT